MIIAGPTAVGKSALAVGLCKRIGGEVVSADSVQVYRGMDIGSAKITRQEMEGVPHHLLSILEPAEEFNVSLFQSLAKEAIGRIRNRGHLPVLTGGTGFYIQSVLYDISFNEGETDPKVRKDLEEEAEKLGTKAMEERLFLIDPESAALYHGNRKRIIRALEYHALTGLLFSDKNRQEKEKRPAYDAAFFWINMPRQLLYERINERVRCMLEAGLEEEVKLLLASGVPASALSMRSLGYRQMAEYLAGECTLEEAAERIRLETRHFAKRQITWFKHTAEAIEINRADFSGEEEILAFMEEICRSD